jgi:serine/threonine-protein kinase
MGSPKYMAPEQIQGGVVDARTDVYSLGIMMYEMLAGKVPFERPTSVNILMAHVGEPPPPMRAVNPNIVISPNFEELVMRCIAKDPNERYKTMDAVLQAIKQAHGVSMTGQLAAVNMSGAYMPIGTNPPPAVHSSHPGLSGSGSGGLLARIPAVSSGSHTPMGMLRADGSGESGMMGGPYSEPAPPRSKAWIGVGVLVAAALGGLLGMAAFRMTAPTSSGTTSRPPLPTGVPVGVDPAGAAPSATVALTGAGSPSASSAPSADARTATLKVTTEPPGASVREDATELCAATPCDITWKGDAADPARVHKLLFAHQGFRPELRLVKPGEALVHARLYRGTFVGGGRPVVPQSSAKPAETTSNGFKDLPY